MNIKQTCLSLLGAALAVACPGLSAGDDVNELSRQATDPTASLMAFNFQGIYDWEAGRWINLPVGLQLGKVTKFGRLPVRISVNPQYNLKDDTGLPDWSVTLTFTALFPPVRKIPR